MDSIYYIDRKTGKRCQELVYGAKFIKLLYGDCLATTLFGRPLAYLLARIPLFSAFYGMVQKSRWSKRKVLPFIDAFQVDTAEFVDDPQSFHSFNDFFIRKLKPEARPIAKGTDVAVIPADGRYLFYQHLDQVDGIVVKGEKFELAALLGDAQLALEYAKGSMVIARLCPMDYHRFHFPCDCVASETRMINGWLYSVNPVAIKKNIHIFSENKRTLCLLESREFGKVLFLEIGATCVGSIHQTYTSGVETLKGGEKGYFSFGGSSLILLFPPGRICFDEDLIKATQQNMEIRCLMGQPMGRLYRNTLKN